MPCHSYSVPMQLSYILVVIRCIRTRMGVTVPQNWVRAVRGCASYRPQRSNVSICPHPNNTLHKRLLYHSNVCFLAVISYVLTIASSHITIVFVPHIDEYLRPRPELDLGSLDGVECRPKYGRIHLHRPSGHERCLSCRFSIDTSRTKAACSILNTMVTWKQSTDFNKQLLEELVLLLLCRNSHDDQVEEEVQACHNKFNDYAARNQEMIQHIAQPVQPRITQWLKDYEPMRQAVFGNKQWFSIQQSLLSELTRCRVSLQGALQKSSEAQKAAEHALVSKSEVESALGDVSRELRGKQRSFKKTKDWTFHLSRLNRDLRSQCKNLEEKLESQKEDLADAKRSKETMSDEIELIRGELQSILSDQERKDPMNLLSQNDS